MASETNNLVSKWSDFQQKTIIIRLCGCQAISARLASVSLWWIIYQLQIGKVERFQMQ